MAKPPLRILLTAFILSWCLLLITISTRVTAVPAPDAIPSVSLAKTEKSWQSASTVHVRWSTRNHPSEATLDLTLRTDKKIDSYLALHLPANKRSTIVTLPPEGLLPPGEYTLHLALRSPTGDIVASDTRNIRLSNKKLRKRRTPTDDEFKVRIKSRKWHRGSKQIVRWSGSLSESATVEVLLWREGHVNAWIDKQGIPASRGKYELVIPKNTPLGTYFVEIWVHENGKPKGWSARSETIKVVRRPKKKNEREKRLLAQLYAQM